MLIRSSLTIRNRSSNSSIHQVAKRLQDKSSSTANTAGATDTGPLLTLAYPDRIAQRSSSHSARYQLSNGRGASLRDNDSPIRHEWLVAADLDDKTREATIYFAAPVHIADIEQDLAHLISESEDALWDNRRGTVLARRLRKLGELILEETELAQPEPALIQHSLLNAVPKMRCLKPLPRSQRLGSLPTCSGRDFTIRANSVPAPWPWPLLDRSIGLAE